MRKHVLLICLFFTGICFASEERPIRFVNTFVGSAPAITIGANNHAETLNEVFGQTMPSVQLPNGMTSWTPQTRLTEKKGVSPYYYNDSTFYGFRASHWLNGGFTQDYGSVTIMGITGSRVLRSSERVAKYKHSEEKASPAYYGVYLPGYHLFNEISATSRAAMINFTSGQKDSLYIVISPNSDQSKGYIEIDPEKKQIRGYNPVHRIYQGSGQEAGFSGYFVIEIDRPFTVYGTYSDRTVEAQGVQCSKQPDLGAYIGLAVKKGERVSVKCGTSFTSMAEAAKNLSAEIPGWSFDQVKRHAEDVWNRHLSAITVKTTTDADKELFYSALYRCSILPRTVSDVDGSYPSFAGGKTTEVAKDFIYYDDFSAWDTYRALMPLLNITEPKKVGDMMESLVKKYEQGGWLPIFPCWNSYTAAMIGDHLIAMISDAYLKGTPIRNIDQAYEAMRKNAFEQPERAADYNNGMGRRALFSYLKYGYIPLEDPVKEAFHKGEQVSRTIEYAYDDFALSQVAAKLNKTNDYRLLSERALNYRNVIDPITGYARGRYANGDFVADFNPFKNQPYITEGYPCQYTWYAPHDVAGLMKLMGGKERFVSKLDSLFSEKLYWHGNEPSHQIAYLYNWTGEAWKTQQHVAEILRREYKNKTGGLSGNDDAGQMSAWYVFSSIGFYPVCPGTTQYIIGTPKHPQTTIKVKDNKQFCVIARNVNDKNIYIQSAKLNGKAYHKTFIDHQDIMNGGTLEFVMGSTPSAWGSKKEDAPYSFSDF